MSKNNAHKLTKIVATIGPVSDSNETIEKLIRAGVNVFRFNFKHNTVEWHSERIQRVNKVAKKIGFSVGTLIDLQGPTIRINMPYDELKIEKGDRLIFGEESFQKKEKGFSMSHPDIIKHIAVGQKLLADDGCFTFYIERSGKKTYLRSETSGILKNRKALNIPGSNFPFPVLIERDFEGLALAARESVDIVAMSFVRSAEDIKIVRKEMKKYKLNAKICAKIETQKGIDNLDEIIEETDSIMVARGDLGVELPLEQVPFYQKEMIKKCLEKGKPVITATQMLQSMVTSPFPTRAEVSDVANAVYDYTDAVMLSAESATGTYPVITVETMSRIVKYSEVKFARDTRKLFDYLITDHEDSICDAAYNLYFQSMVQPVKVAAFLVFTHTGRTARTISRYRPMVPVFAFTPTTDVRDSLNVNFGVFPFLQEELKKMNEVKKDDVLRAIKLLVSKKMLYKGDKVIVLHGDYWAVKDGLSTLKLVTVA